MPTPLTQVSGCDFVIKSSGISRFVRSGLGSIRLLTYSRRLPEIVNRKLANPRIRSAIHSQLKQVNSCTRVLLSFAGRAGITCATIEEKLND